MIVAQTLVEYGFLNSIVAGIAATRDRIESYIGSDNLKYTLILVFVIFILLVVRRRRA